MSSPGMWMGLAIAVAPAIVWGQSPSDDGPVSAIIAVAELQGAESRTETGFVIRRADDDDGTNEEIQVIIGEGAPATRFFIGLDCAPAEDALRAQLGLEAGLVVRSVADDSPAKAAGLQMHDVIIAAKLDDKDHQIASVPQLSELIQRAGTKPVTLTVVRGGKKITASVTPAERPGVAQAAHEARGRPRPMPRGGAGPGVGFGGPAPWRLQMGRQGPPSDGAPPVKLPEKMQVAFTKAGDDVQVTVSMDGSTWTAKVNELDKLPAEPRSALARFLGFHVMPKVFQSSAGAFGPFGRPFGMGPVPGMMHQPRGPGQGPPPGDAGDHHRRGRGGETGRRGGHDEERDRHPRRAHSSRGRFRHHARHGGCPHCRAMRQAAAHQRGFGLHGGWGHGWMAHQHPGLRFWMAHRAAMAPWGRMGFGWGMFGGQGRFGSPPFGMTARGGPAAGPHHPHSDPHHHPHGEQRPAGGDLGARLEKLVQHLERIHGRPADERRPAHPEAIEHLRAKLREMQEQQERLADSLRHISKALEELQRK